MRRHGSRLAAALAAWPLRPRLRHREVEPDPEREHHRSRRTASTSVEQRIQAVAHAWGPQGRLPGDLQRRRAGDPRRSAATRCRARSPASAGRTPTRTRPTGARRASRAAPTPDGRDGRRPQGADHELAPRGRGPGAYARITLHTRPRSPTTARRTGTCCSSFRGAAGDIGLVTVPRGRPRVGRQAPLRGVHGPACRCSTWTTSSRSSRTAATSSRDATTTSCPQSGSYDGSPRNPGLTLLVGLGRPLGRPARARDVGVQPATRPAGGSCAGRSTAPA